MKQHGPRGRRRGANADALPQSAEERLALEMLGRLQQRAARAHDLLKEDGEIDVADGDANMPRRVLLQSDKVTYAVRLAFCLAAHFPTVVDMTAGGAFVVIKASATDDAMVIGDVLGDVVVYEAKRVAFNPIHGLRAGERFVVLADVSARFSDGSVTAIAEAMQRKVPVFCVSSPAALLPTPLLGADLHLELPPLNREMLRLIFQVCHEEVPAELASFLGAERLQTADIVGHVRPGRPASACLSSLANVARSRDQNVSGSTLKLHDLAGYGRARSWGLELAQDVNLWRQGLLVWEEVDHRSVVLSGPPGTGKTRFASVLAATLELPLIGTSVAEWNARDHLSGTLKRMKAVFDEAIAKAPCVLFIDELDGISSRETVEGRYSEYWTQIVNLMLELITAALAKEGVIIVGATNHIGRIDRAILRSGRMDEIIRIEPPDREALVEILSYYAGPSVAKSDLAALAGRLQGKTGADIEKMVRAAKASARRAGRPFTFADLEDQAPDPFQSFPSHVRRRITTYGRGQRLVAQVLGLAEMTDRAQGWALGELLAKSLNEDRFPTEQYCNDVLAVIMAGRAAEEIVCGDVSTLGSYTLTSDLAVATAIARDLELRTGLGETGVIFLDQSQAGLEPPSSVQGSIRRRIEAALARASALLLDNLDELEPQPRAGNPGKSLGTSRPTMKVVH